MLYLPIKSCELCAVIDLSILLNRTLSTRNIPSILARYMVYNIYLLIHIVIISTNVSCKFDYEIIL